VLLQLIATCIFGFRFRLRLDEWIVAVHHDSFYVSVLMLILTSFSLHNVGESRGHTLYLKLTQYEINKTQVQYRTLHQHH